jgi:hypothetical protein
MDKEMVGLIGLATGVGVTLGYLYMAQKYNWPVPFKQPQRVQYVTVAQPKQLGASSLIQID